MGEIAVVPATLFLPFAGVEDMIAELLTSNTGLPVTDCGWRNCNGTVWPLVEMGRVLVADVASKTGQ